MDKFIDLICKINAFDKFLILLLLISILAKILSKTYGIILLRRYNHKYQQRTEPCLHLKLDSPPECKLSKHRKKHFINQGCSADCPGYTKEKLTSEDIKTLYNIPFIISTILDFTSDLSTIILIIRTLFAVFS